MDNLSSRPKPSILVYNITKDKLIVGTNTDLQRPLGSFAKLLLVLLTVDQDHLELLEVKTIIKDRNLDTNLTAGTYTRGELLQAVLITSDNSAAHALAENYPGGLEQSLVEMNMLSKQLGMTDTVIVDHPGIKNDNVSTAKDLHLLLLEVAKNDFIKNTSIIKELVLKNGLELRNRNNPLLYRFPEITITKTARTPDAGSGTVLIIEKNQIQHSLVAIGFADPDQRRAMISKILEQHLK